MDEGGRRVKFWKVETAGVDLKDRVRQRDRHSAAGAGRQMHLNTLVWFGVIRNEYLILLGNLHGEENHLEVLDIDGEIIIKPVLEKLHVELAYRIEFGVRPFSAVNF
jgi:hypothetical protein